jgi:hypothetical protein
MTATSNSRRVAGETRPRALATSAEPTARWVDAEVPLRDIVDVWGQDSFPASDAPANW